MLVSPKRIVKRFADMTSEEVKDLFITAHQIVPAIEQHYNGTSTNIAIQDGKDAGQSVEVRMKICACVIIIPIIIFMCNLQHFWLVHLLKKSSKKIFLNGLKCMRTVIAVTFVPCQCTCTHAVHKHTYTYTHACNAHKQTYAYARWGWAVLQFGAQYNNCVEKYSYITVL